MKREYLAVLREKRNESQQSVANALGMSRQYYSMIEKGDRQQNMDMLILDKLSSHFGVPISRMVKWEQNYIKSRKRM